MFNLKSKWNALKEWCSTSLKRVSNAIKSVAPPTTVFIPMFPLWIIGCIVVMENPDLFWYALLVFFLCDFAMEFWFKSIRLQKDINQHIIKVISLTSRLSEAKSLLAEANGMIEAHALANKKLINERNQAVDSVGQQNLKYNALLEEFSQLRKERDIMINRNVELTKDNNILVESDLRKDEIINSLNKANNELSEELKQVKFQVVEMQPKPRAKRKPKSE
jgi:hypothetical protein